jgi:hypothetical protein
MKTVVNNIMARSFLILVVAVSSAYAQSTLFLQKECAEGAKKLIENANNVLTYSSHYNNRLDRCFMRVGFTFASIEEKAK